MKDTTGGCAVLHWVILILCQGLEEKPNSPLKVFKAAVFILAQLDYEAVIHMSMPANLNKKYVGKRSCFAQISFDKPHLGAVGQTKPRPGTVGTTGLRAHLPGKEAPGWQITAAKL